MHQSDQSSGGKVPAVCKSRVTDLSKHPRQQKGNLLKYISLYFRTCFQTNFRMTLFQKSSSPYPKRILITFLLVIDSKFEMLPLCSRNVCISLIFQSIFTSPLWSYQTFLLPHDHSNLTLSFMSYKLSFPFKIFFPNKMATMRISASSPQRIDAPDYYCHFHYSSMD